MALPLYMMGLALAAYTILIITSWELWWDLHSFRHDMSPPTREMNIQLTKVLIIQAAVPSIFTLMPPTVATTYSWITGHPPLSHIGLWVAILMSISSVIDPLSTILILPGYRRVLMRKFMLLRTGGSSYGVSEETLESSRHKSSATESVGCRKSSAPGSLGGRKSTLVSTIPTVSFNCHGGRG